MEGGAGEAKEGGLPVIEKALCRQQVILNQGISKVLEGFINASRFRDATRSKNSPEKLAPPEGNSLLGSNCPNTKSPKTH